MHCTHISFQTLLFHSGFSWIIHGLVQTPCKLPVLHLYFFTALSVFCCIQEAVCVAQTNGKRSVLHDTCPWSCHLSDYTGWYFWHRVSLCANMFSWIMCFDIKETEKFTESWGDKHLFVRPLISIRRILKFFSCDSGHIFTDKKKKRLHYIVETLTAFAWIS